MYNDPHWINLSPPLSPSTGDVLIYKELIRGTSLLLGSTKELLPLVSTAIDLVPKYPDRKIQCYDWLDFSQFYDTVIADGCLNLTMELAIAIQEKYSHLCYRFISRCFNHKLSGMKYASYFPNKHDFLYTPVNSIIFSDYTFYVWDF